MPQIKFDITNEEKKALDAMLPDGVESYIKGLVETHELNEVDRKWNKKTYAEKKELIPDD